MKYGKRQLILASLVLALGAAGVLNWQFAGTKVQSCGRCQARKVRLPLSVRRSL